MRGGTSSTFVGLCVAVAVLAGAPASRAQIVNTQPLLGKVQADGLNGEVGASLDWRTGNVALLRVIGSALFTYRTGEHTLIWSSKGDYGESGGDPFISQVFSHLRYQARLGEVLTWEVFGQVSSARFKRLRFRGLVGTGPRVALVEGEAGGVSVGVAYMFEHESLNTSDYPASGRTDAHHRLSAYVTGRVSLAEQLSLVHTTYLQPRFDAFADDVRVSSETDLVVSLAKRLAITLGFDLAYDAEPPAGVDSLDTALTVGLSWGF